MRSSLRARPSTALKPRRPHAETEREDKRLALVMIHTFFGRLGHGPRGSSSTDLESARGCSTFAHEAGFALIEVLISAVLIALIVIATFTGFDASNRATGDERAHAQADVLAQQDEDRLRGKQINQLSGLNETRTLTYNGTTYSITSTGEFLSDSTETASCVKEAQSASYVRTTSKVTWPALGSRPAVVETGLITPPIGGELLAQVFDGNGEGVSGMTVQATGPSPSTAVVSATTGANGCVIFSSLTEGEYSVNTFQSGYVDKDGNSEPPASQRAVSITTGATAKKSFQFARGGALKVTFVNSSNVEVEGDTFVAYNTNMTLPSIRLFGTQGTYAKTITSPTTLFPFGEPGPPPTSPYSVYAGSCEANKPPSAYEKSTNVTPGGTSAISVVEPPINIEVWSGTSSASKGSLVTTASGTLKGTLTDSGCASAAARTFTALSAGKLQHPNTPFGTYALCVTAQISSTNRRVRVSPIANSSAAGTATQVIYLGAGEEKSTCP